MKFLFGARINGDDVVLNRSHVLKCQREEGRVVIYLDNGERLVMDEPDYDKEQFWKNVQFVLLNQDDK